MIVECQINEIDKELNNDKFESNLGNNIIQKPKVFVNRLKEIPILLHLDIFQQEGQLTFPLGLSQRKPHPLKKIVLP